VDTVDTVARLLESGLKSWAYSDNVSQNVSQKLASFRKPLILLANYRSNTGNPALTH
jgi:hypothetical protein